MKQTAIERAFLKAAEQRRCAFVPYVTGGFPEPSTCEKLLLALAENGADIVEVGLPFSDPMADGPTIQWASRVALDNGTTPAAVFDMIARSQARLSCPVVLMTYYNPMLKMGLSEFARRATEAGVAGVVIPDLPPEEADEWLEAATDRLDTIFLVAPTTPRSRMQWIMSKSGGFVYYVSMTGVTGSDFVVSDQILDDVREAAALSPLPLAVGFGISTPEHARKLGAVADGVIVGSALIREIRSYSEPSAQISAVARMATDLSRALVR